MNPTQGERRTFAWRALIEWSQMNARSIPKALTSFAPLAHLIDSSEQLQGKISRVLNRNLRNVNRCTVEPAAVGKGIANYHHDKDEGDRFHHESRLSLRG